MSSSFKRRLAFQVLFPVRYRYDLLTALPAFQGRKCRVLLASDQLNATSEAQFDPLLRSRGLLRTYGVVLDERVLADVLSENRRGSYDAILAKLSFLTPAAEAVRQLTQLRVMYPEAALIYMDGDDDACVQWPELLPLVDLYVKKHMFADRSWYQKQFSGKNNLTDYVARHHGRSFADNAIPQSAIVPSELLGKVVIGWNIADDNKIADLFTANSAAPEKDRSTAVMCRAACAEEHWIYPLRGPINQALAPLTGKGYTVLLPSHRVDQQTYYDEMRSSRICISPFGYGELCWRDFEAVIMGCLLIKPDMGHLATDPNIFIPNETYVPCAWDFSDLAEICERCLKTPEESSRIARNAYEALQQHYKGHVAVRRFVELLSAATSHTSVKSTGSLVHAV